MVQGIYFDPETRSFSLIESTEIYADAEKESDRKSKAKKAALIAAGVAGAGLVGYGAYKYAKGAPTRALAKKNNPIAAKMAEAQKSNATLAERVAMAKSQGVYDKKNFKKDIDAARATKKELGKGRTQVLRAMKEDDAKRMRAAMATAASKAKKAGQKFDPTKFAAEWKAKNHVYSNID